MQLDRKGFSKLQLNEGAKSSTKIKLRGPVYIYQLILASWSQIPKLRAQNLGRIYFPGEESHLCCFLGDKRDVSVARGSTTKSLQPEDLHQRLGIMGVTVNYTGHSELVGLLG